MSGNQSAREALMYELIDRTELYNNTNMRGEHIALFLAKKLARLVFIHLGSVNVFLLRQQQEQMHEPRRAKRNAPPSARDATIPEHDLEPPKFAQYVVFHCYLS